MIEEKRNPEYIFEPSKGDTLEVTGICKNGKRFIIHCGNVVHFRGINLWRGSRWLRKGLTNKRHLIERIFN